MSSFSSLRCRFVVLFPRTPRPQGYDEDPEGWWVPHPGLRVVSQLRQGRVQDDDTQDDVVWHTPSVPMLTSSTGKDCGHYRG